MHRLWLQPVCGSSEWSQHAAPEQVSWVCVTTRALWRCKHERIGIPSRQSCSVTAVRSAQVFYALRELQHACTANLVETRVVSARLDLLNGAVTRLADTAGKGAGPLPGGVAPGGAVYALCFAAVTGAVFGAAFAATAMLAFPHS